MATPPFKSGDFVWTRFPFEERPDQPAEIRHAACVIACFSRSSAGAATTTPADQSGLVVGVYTSSQILKFGDTVPVGLIQVSRERAHRMGNGKPFFIDVRKRAFMPFSKAFFPDIDNPGHGLIGTVDRGLFSEIVRQYRLVNERHPRLIVNVGPLRPL